MFKDNYKKQIDNIKPDGYIKDKVRRKIAERESKEKKVLPKSYLLRAAAALVCICLVFTAGAVIGRHTAPNTPTVQNIKLMKTATDYDKIYSALEDFKDSLWDRVRVYATGGNKSDNYMVEESVVDDTESNTSAKPGASTYNSADNGGKGEDGHSETTTQVDGVDEADVVKTDGKYIYILSRKYGKEQVKIVEAGENPRQLSDIEIEEDGYSTDLYLNGDRLVVLWIKNGSSEVTAIIYDVSDPNNPQKTQACTQSGYLNTSRLIGNKLYIISNLYINVNNMVKSDTESYMPYIRCGEYDGAVDAQSVHFYDECQSPQFTVISAFNIKDGSLISTQSVLGGTETVYSSTDNIIVADMGTGDETQIARFRIQDGQIELKASAKLSGRPLNQFSIDEYKEHFRFVLTENKTVNTETTAKDGSTVSKFTSSSTTVNSLVILDSDLKETGKITDIAPTERVYSVRFMGDTAYFVTFRQVDPLFSVDVSDPKNPEIIGALKIPGFSNYLFPFGEGKLLGIGQNADENTGKTGSMKLSMFDISDPSNVTEQDKTDIPAVYSEGLYNHKAVLADYDRNIIAFSGKGIYKQNAFFVYSYENGSFIKRLEAAIPNTGICRGIYIGKTFYIVTDVSIEYYDMLNFRKLGKLELN